MRANTRLCGTADILAGMAFITANGSCSFTGDKLPELMKEGWFCLWELIFPELLKIKICPALAAKCGFGKGGFQLFEPAVRTIRADFSRLL